MFDYKGYCEKKLRKLCSESKAISGRCSWVYWTSEVYSFGRHYRNYGFYPAFLPLYVYSDHGIGNPSVAKHEIENDAEHMFVICDEKAEAYKKVSTKPCSVVMAPFVWYRRSKNINQVKNPRGTLAFPAHSTPDLKSEFDIEAYIMELKNLPEDMQPVCVCLHMHDINAGQHKIFMQHGIPVYTAGNAFDVRFAKRYYDILKNFKYTTSNHIGSYTYYSVEMGIPFSLLGEPTNYINISDKNLKKGVYDYRNDVYKKKEELFKGINTSVNNEQKEIVAKYLGINSGISRKEFSKILWSAYRKRGNFFKDFKLLIKNLFRKKVKR